MVFFLRCNLCSNMSLGPHRESQANVETCVIYRDEPSNCPVAMSDHWLAILTLLWIPNKFLVDPQQSSISMTKYFIINIKPTLFSHFCWYPMSSPMSWLNYSTVGRSTLTLNPTFWSFLELVYHENVFPTWPLSIVAISLPKNGLYYVLQWSPNHELS